jgi:hypothetical protein
MKSQISSANDPFIRSSSRPCTTADFSKISYILSGNSRDDERFGEPYLKGKIGVSIIQHQEISLRENYEYIIHW